ncbi:hypothetical protein [Burkholderia perseverans]|uniref:hypothetical protein n=1 Tax=Burkholderia perseverans TaxID=2615214 RepID=UPI001FEEAC9A|nr:hypothetical protein [Burkholderia perseverans]
MSKIPLQNRPGESVSDQLYVEIFRGGLKLAIRDYQFCDREGAFYAAVLCAESARECLSKLGGMAGEW